MTVHTVGADQRPREVIAIVTVDEMMWGDQPMLDALDHELNHLLDHHAAKLGATVTWREHQPAQLETDHEFRVRQSITDRLARERGETPRPLTRRLVHRISRGGLDYGTLSS